jgi:hypothetical protein
MSVCAVRFCACPHARACVGQGRARPRRWAGGAAERVSAGRRVRQLELSWTARAYRVLVYFHTQCAGTFAIMPWHGPDTSNNDASAAMINRRSQKASIVRVRSAAAKLPSPRFVIARSLSRATSRSPPHSRSVSPHVRSFEIEEIPNPESEKEPGQVYLLKVQVVFQQKIYSS